MGSTNITTVYFIRQFEPHTYRVWKVCGNRLESEHFVAFSGCNCDGFKFNGKCRHIDMTTGNWHNGDSVPIGVARSVSDKIKGELSRFCNKIDASAVRGADDGEVSMVEMWMHGSDTVPQLIYAEVPVRKEKGRGHYTMMFQIVMSSVRDEDEDKLSEVDFDIYGVIGGS